MTIFLPYERNMTMNIHTGTLLESSPLINVDRLQAIDILGEYIDAFLVGYYDRTSEELDRRSYVQVDTVKTVLELFYKAGYILAHHDIALGAVHKGITEMSDLREIAKQYLYRFNVKLFYEKNS
jgi:hypothetical protein